MADRFINPVPQFLDDSGDPLILGLLHFKENGTDTDKDTFKDVNKKILNSNPVELTGSGRTPNIFYDGTARVILTDEDGIIGGITYFDKDGVGQPGSGSAFEDWSSITEYAIGDLVEATDGEYYRSLQNNNLGNDPVSSTAFWERVEFLRTWNENVTYGNDANAKDSDGLIYRSLQDNNLNNQPSLSPDFWGTPVAFVDLNILGDLSFAATELTISAGSVAAETSHHTIDTEADAASDTLTTITVVGVADFTLLFLRLENAARVVTLEDGTGNIQTKGNKDVVLDANFTTVLFRVGTDFFVIDNPFDQYLNSTDNVQFNDVDASGLVHISRVSANDQLKLERTGTTTAAMVLGAVGDDLRINDANNGDAEVVRMSLTSLKIPGIGDFSAAGIYLGAAVASNNLDDYEEGTFTATLATGATTTPTVTLNYTKIGNTVRIFAAALFGTHTNDGVGITITGLPFAVSDRARFAAGGPQRTVFSTTENLYWEINGTTLSLIEIPPSSATQTGVASSAVSQNPSYAEFNFVYQTT